MTERSRNVAVGLTGLVALVMAAVILSLFGWVPFWLEEGYTIEAVFTNSMGLTPGSRVRLAGIDVGRVDRVTLQEIDSGDSKTQGVVVMALINTGTQIPQGSSARVEATLLGTSPALALDPPRVKLDEQFTYLPTDGTAKLQGQMGGLTSDIQGAVSRIEGRFDQVIGDFHSLAAEYAKVGQNFNQLLEPRTPASVDSGEKGGNLSTIVARTDQRLREMEASIKAVQGWLDDAELRANIKTTLANSAKISEKLSTTADQAATMVTSTQGQIDKLTKRYIAVADDLSAAVGSMQKLVDATRTGDGTAGKLIQDPALYNNLNDSAVRLKEALTELKLLVEKMKKEGLPLQY